ncbi:MAG TPA: BON domain-containing protein [Thermoanaerobaculia bacterium]
MTNHFRRVLPIAAVVLGFALLGCRTTQTPGEQVSDHAIKAKVKTRLTADRFSNIVNISVDVTNGIVTLAGEVPDEQTRRDAEIETRRVDGVRRVNNNLQVSRRR